MVSDDDDHAESSDSRIEEAVGAKFDKMVDGLAREEKNTCPAGLSSRSSELVKSGKITIHHVATQAMLEDPGPKQNEKQHRDVGGFKSRGCRKLKKGEHKQAFLSSMMYMSVERFTYVVAVRAVCCCCAAAAVVLRRWMLLKLKREKCGFEIFHR